jgi:hypothetical protein
MQTICVAPGATTTILRTEISVLVSAALKTLEQGKPARLRP